MRCGLIVAGALTALALPGTGVAQEPGADELIERLRQATRDIPAVTAAPDAEPERPGIEDGLSPDEVRQRVAEQIDVEVLEVRAAEAEMGPVYAVKVMNPPGNSDSAFMVGTLLVDAETGEVLGRAAGSATFSKDAPLVRDPGVDAGGPELRRRTYR